MTSSRTAESPNPSSGPVPHDRYDLSAYNPFGPHLGVMYEMLRQARETTPVFFSEPLQAWCLTRYDDVRAVAADPETFSSKGVFPRPVGLQEDAQRAMDHLFDDPILTIQDPPDHGPQRRITYEGFGPRSIAAFAPAVREIIEGFADRLPRDEPFNLAEEFSDRITLAAAMKVVGFADEDYDRFSRWVHDGILLAFSGPLLSVADQERYGKYVNDGYAYVSDLVDERRADPKDDLISMIVHGEFQGRRLTHKEVVNIATGLISAGWHTTGGALTNIMAVLLERPERWDALVNGGVSAEDVVTEGLRHDNSTVGFFRTVTRDTRVGDVDLRAGDRIFLSYAAANHDPAKFAEPEEFRPGRPNASAFLSFGHGIHYCIGAPLAKLELQYALEALAARYPGLRAQGEPVRYKELSQFKTPESLWVVP
ncbi:cytochrome P450 [Actinocorallia sp. B10E7]|uniref:cytochrome P450 n=1 Tax=Actinocorallia sp. B10E7 TaxID=3153558 RepID=UPI00325F03C3